MIAIGIHTGCLEMIYSILVDSSYYIIKARLAITLRGRANPHGMTLWEISLFAMVQTYDAYVGGGAQC